MSRSLGENMLQAEGRGREASVLGNSLRPHSLHSGPQIVTLQLPAGRHPKAGTGTRRLGRAGAVGRRRGRSNAWRVRSGSQRFWAFAPRRHDIVFKDLFPTSPPGSVMVSDEALLSSEPLALEMQL